MTSLLQPQADPLVPTPSIAEFPLASAISPEVVDVCSSHAYGQPAGPDPFGEPADSSVPAIRPPRISVVVATRQRHLFLNDLVHSLQAQSIPAQDFEVVFVDDGSSDATWKELESIAARSRLRFLGLRLADSVGQGQARNIGITAARGAIVAFTDDDCVVSPHWLESLTAPFGPPGDNDAVDELPQLVVQGRTVPWSDDGDDAGPWDRTVWVLRTTWLFETCNIAYRHIDLDCVGGFPSRRQAPSTSGGKAVGEDALLGLQVAGLGVATVFVPGAEVFHRHHPATYGQWLRSQAGKQVFPDLVRRNPAIRRALWHRWFLAPRTAAFDLAVVGTSLAVSTRRVTWLAAALPWVWLALPEAADRRGRHPGVRLAQLWAGDTVGLVALIRSTIRNRRVVL